MKKDFFDHMHEIMEKHENVFFLMCGLGYPRVDEFLSKYPDRAFNTEASEQTALDMAVGLAYAGKVPVLYTISPFFLRGFETIRTYINHEKLPVIMVGAGRNEEYSEHDGFSHYEGDMNSLFLSLKNISFGRPITTGQMKTALEQAVTSEKPWYINIKRN